MLKYNPPPPPYPKKNKQTYCFCLWMDECVPHLLFGDAYIAEVRLEALVRWLGEYPVAAESLPEHRLQAEIRFFWVVGHDHKEGHRHNQTGGNQQLPLWREKKCACDQVDNDMLVYHIISEDIRYNTTEIRRTVSIRCNDCQYFIESLLTSSFICCLIQFIK